MAQSLDSPGLQEVDANGDVADAETSQQRPSAASSAVSRAVEGDREALRELLMDVTPSIARAVRTIVGVDAPNVDDLTQEAMLSFVRALPAFRGDSSIVRYAYRVGVRTAMAFCRRRNARRQLFEGFARDEQIRWGREPTDVFVKDARRRLLRGLLAALPAAQAEAFAHRVVWGASVQEIAEETGAPINTVRARLRSARKALRDRLLREPELIELLGGLR